MFLFRALLNPAAPAGMHDIRRYALHGLCAMAFSAPLAKWACQRPIRKSCRPATFGSQAFRTSRCAGVVKSILAQPRPGGMHNRGSCRPATFSKARSKPQPCCCPARARPHCGGSRPAGPSGAGTAASPPAGRSLAEPPRSDIRREVRARKTAPAPSPPWRNAA